MANKEVVVVVGSLVRKSRTLWWQYVLDVCSTPLKPRCFGCFCRIRTECPVGWLAGWPYGATILLYGEVWWIVFSSKVCVLYMWMWMCRWIYAFFRVHKLSYYWVYGMCRLLSLFCCKTLDGLYGFHIMRLYMPMSSGHVNQTSK